jgi:hypothetical protein
MRPLPISLLAAALVAPAVAQSKTVRVLPSEAGTTRTELAFPQLGTTVTDVRRVLADGRVERFGLTADGELVDVDALRLADHALELERFGKVDSTLRGRIDEAAPGQALEVAFWLLEPADGFDPAATIRAAAEGLPRELVPAATRAARAEALALNAERLSPRVDAFSAAVADAGGTPVVRGLGWPIVIARVDVERVAELAAHPLVDTAYVSQPAWAPEGDDAQGTMRTYDVHDQGVLADGSVKVMVQDVGGVDLNNPYLPPVTVLIPDFDDSHATGVAGNICNTHPQYYAAAHTLPEIYSAPGSSDAEAPNAWSLGISAGVDFGACSWWNFLKGKIEFLDRFFDYTVRNFSVMMFKSNGNQGGGSAPYSTTPGNGYNVVATGNYNANGDDNWANDFMTSSSSWWNPVEGHEKPEVASPGDCIPSTSTGGGGITTCFGGTSSASPLTCGVATLFTSADPTLLGQMTTVKATLMASAWHNVEGAALISDRDGAGGTHAKAAHALVRDQQWWFNDVVDADFVGGVLDVTMPLVAGDETRVVSLWFSSANASYSTDVLEMDLDMAVLDPQGGVVATSASAANPFEIASFVPAMTGDYTVRLTKQRFDGTSEPLTVAWSTRNDTGTTQVRLAHGSAPFAIGQSPTFRISDRYLGAGSAYAAWPSASSASAGPLPGGWAIPVGFDALSNLALTLPGWAGTLGGAGTALAALPIPPLPAIAGLELAFGGVIWQPFAFPAGAPISVSDPMVLTILP